MTDKLKKEQRSENMRRIRDRDTKPELFVRRLVHNIGYRYRLRRNDLPGKPDLAFGPRRKVIFVHGCFWHQHEKGTCSKGRLPKSNLDYWKPKLERNVERDNINQQKLFDMGWQVLVIWECEANNSENIHQRITAFLNDTD